MDCHNHVLHRLKLKTERLTARVKLLTAPGNIGRHGPRRVEWECACVISTVWSTS